MEIDGIIPGGFLQVSGGPVFEDLCRDLPSYWMVLAPSDSGNEDRRTARKSDPPKSGGITVTVPAGGTATVIVIQGGGTVVISL